jgi:large repetitive protein
VKLNGNLLCPQETGLVVGADGIDIDLNGYTIDGGISVGGGGPPGIDNSAGHGDVTIRNGTLQGFGIPVSIVGASHNRVLDITSSGANTAVKIQGGSDNEIRRNDAFGRSWGITVEDSDDVVVADTRVSAGFSWGMAVSGDYARIVRNHAVDQGESPGNDNGIALIGAHGRVAGNRVEGPWTLGALEIFGPDNRVVDNIVTGAALPIGPVPSEAIGDGIVVLTDSQGTVLRRNRADANEGDGIQVMSAGVRLGDNTANDNGDFGIDAAAGSTDLGGNTATGNGNPLQCRNVFCP